MPRRHRLRPAVVLSIAALCSLAAATGARADGDPASDTLYQQTVFYSNGTVSPALASELERATLGTQRAGKPVRVALIATAADLGAVPSLFGRPSTYARFLGIELEFVYPGRLLVVMPQGAALSQKGRLIGDPAVAKAKVGSGGDGLARTALQLVHDLTPGTTKRFGSTPRSAPVPASPARRSSRVAAPSARSVPAARGVPMWEATVAACAAVGILAGGGLVLVRRRAPTPGPLAPPAPTAPPDPNDPYRYTGPF